MIVGKSGLFGNFQINNRKFVKQKERARLSYGVMPRGSLKWLIYLASVQVNRFVPYKVSENHAEPFAYQQLGIHGLRGFSGRSRSRNNKARCTTTRASAQFTDGSPVSLPTDKTLEAMLAATSRHPDEVIGNIQTSATPATVRNVAILGIMAGLKP